MSFRDDLYERVGPWAYADPDNGYALRTLCYGLASMFAEVEDIAIATDDLPGWAMALSVEDEDGNARTPYNLLPWLGQFVGVRIPTGTADADARVLVKRAEGLSRGTRASIVAGVQRLLIGNKSIIVKERDGGPYKLTVYTYQQESPVTDYATITNLVTNPNFERGTTGWATSGIGPFVGAGATISRDTTEKFSRTASLKVVTTGTNTGTAHQATKTIAAGEKYTASFWIKGAVGGERLQILLGSSGTDFAQYAAGGGTLEATTQWVRHSVTWTAGGAAGALHLTLRESASGGAPCAFWIDNVQISQHATAVDYIDGDTQGTWTGTPGASSSTSISTTTIRDAILEQKPAGIVLTLNIIANASYANVVALRASYTTVLATYASYSVLREAV